MSHINDRHLTYKDPFGLPPTTPPADFGGVSLVEYIFGRTRAYCKDKGDMDFVVNSSLVLKGEEKDDVGPARLAISQVEPASRAAGKAFGQLLGLQKGDVVHIALPNTTRYFPVTFGVWMCQAVVSLADPSLKPEITASQLEDTQARLFVCSVRNVEACVKARSLAGREGDLKIVVVGDGHKGDEDEGILLYNDLAEKAAALKDEDGPDPGTGWTFDQRMAIFWSSGTTGRPKGIQHNHKLMLAFVDESNVLPGDWVASTCFFHGGGFMAPIGRLAANSCTYFYAPEDLDKTSVPLLYGIDKFKPTYFMGGSHHVMRISAMNDDEFPSGLDLSSLQMIMPMGTNIPVDTKDKLKPHLPRLEVIINIYGLTESGGLIAYSMTPEYLGGAAKHVTVKIADPETEEALEAHQVGEIMVKGAPHMIGYLNRPEENKAFFGKDGFIHTGDYGHYNEEGIIYFDGRMKDLIKVENKHLYPIEVEEVIMKHQDVADAAVFGKPDPLYQELISAAVVLKKGSSATAQDLVKFVEERVEEYKHLRGGVTFMDTIPRSHQGKILRREVKAKVEAMESKEH